MLVLVALALLAGLLAGCAGQVRPECPLGSHPRRVNTDATTSGAAGASVGVVTQSGQGQARWRGAASVDFDCERDCQAGQLLKASRTDKGAVTVECSAIPK